MTVDSVAEALVKVTVAVVTVSVVPVAVTEESVVSVTVMDSVVEAVAVVTVIVVVAVVTVAVVVVVVAVVKVVIIVTVPVVVVVVAEVAEVVVVLVASSSTLVAAAWITKPSPSKLPVRWPGPASTADIEYSRRTLCPVQLIVCATLLKQSARADCVVQQPPWFDAATRASQQSFSGSVSS